ncbi:hypothetical protein STAS_17764 [Striga asiatica]|uniref:Uncharacterized protein n=1 Tax=Striga asiatica TaxID=4170 RepID=A0A5A7QAJ5_STRAF|nr:hypothetical protein STAS_17764 [Striga asiatica]
MVHTRRRRRPYRPTCQHPLTAVSIDSLPRSPESPSTLPPPPTTRLSLPAPSTSRGLLLRHHDESAIGNHASGLAAHRLPPPSTVATPELFFVPPATSFDQHQTDRP